MENQVFQRHHWPSREGGLLDFFRQKRCRCWASQKINLFLKQKWTTNFLTSQLFLFLFFLLHSPHIHTFFFPTWATWIWQWEQFRHVKMQSTGNRKPFECIWRQHWKENFFLGRCLVNPWHACCSQSNWSGIITATKIMDSLAYIHKHLCITG